MTACKDRVHPSFNHVPPTRISIYPAASCSCFNDCPAFGPTSAKHRATCTATLPKRKRAEVKYNEVDKKANELTDSEEEYVTYKRPRISDKQLAKNKIFPFRSLPGEIRNKIYEECLPPPTELPKDCREEPSVWFTYKQRQYRRTVEYVTSVEEEQLEWHCWDFQFANGRNPARGTVGTLRSTGRGRGYQPNSIADFDSDSDEDQEDGPKPLALNILSVCKQIYEEAAPMMYNQKLLFTSAEALFAFASQLSPRTAKLLRHIEIRTWGMSRSRKTSGYSAMSMLAAKGATNLETFHINCAIGWFYSLRYRHHQPREVPVPKRIARKVYRDCCLWLEAVGSASGEWDKGVGVVELTEEMFFDWIGVQSRSECGNSEQDHLSEGVKMYKKELKRLFAQGAW